MTDKITIDGQDIDLGKLVLSPTRTFLPLLKKVLEKYKSSISGIIHNTGGAHTKVKKFAPDKRIIKDNLLTVPPLFDVIKTESGTDFSEMFQVFNMGTRLEIYTDDNTAAGIIDVCHSFNIDAQVVGYVEDAESSQVIVKHNNVDYTY